MKTLLIITLPSLKVKWQWLGTFLYEIACVKVMRRNITAQQVLIKDTCYGSDICVVVTVWVRKFDSKS